MLHEILDLVHKHIRSRKGPDISSQLDLVRFYRAIRETEEFIFLQINNNICEPDVFITDFLHFFLQYSTNTETVTRQFQKIIYNIRITCEICSDPAIRFLTNENANDFNEGYLR
jgi:hypothetical protein